MSSFVFPFLPFYGVVKLFITTISAAQRVAVALCEVRYTNRLKAADACDAEQHGLFNRRSLSFCSVFIVSDG